LNICGVARFLLILRVTLGLGRESEVRIMQADLGRARFGANIQVVSWNVRSVVYSGRDCLTAACTVQERSQRRTVKKSKRCDDSWFQDNARNGW
jgi:hypothetical protein